jgi:transposase-like protein
MPQFNLNEYETVEERHARAISEYPDIRCVIVNHTTPADRAVGTWVVEARVYLNAEDQERELPKATEWAFEVDGVGMANKTSALENACTSALGRSLRWALGGSKGPSKQEMEKVARGQTPRLPKRFFIDEAEALGKDLDKLRLLYSEAKTANASEEVLGRIKELAALAGA